MFCSASYFIEKSRKSAKSKMQDDVFEIVHVIIVQYITVYYAFVFVVNS